jgi:uncharacterized protein YjbI with pentapeptide repeats
MSLPYVGSLNLLLIIGVIAGLVALFAACWLWWRLPKRQVDRFPIDDAKARAEVEDNFRKTISEALLAAAALVGAGLAYLQFTEQQQTSQRQFAAQQEASRAQQEASQKQFAEQQHVSRRQFEQQQQVSRDLLVSNQVAKGFEQLGSEKLVVRLGGVYALEGVMNTSEQYHQPVLEALSAFVRDSTRNTTGAGPPETDIQAALIVVGRRKPIGTGIPNLAYAHIPQAQLSGAHLSGAVLRDADLRDADLSDADLSSADLRYADLRGAHLSGANLGGADLRSADLSSADLSSADLRSADLSSADLRSADLSSADLSNADLSSTDLSLANLFAAIVSQTQFDKACGTDAKLDPGLTLKPCSTSPPRK